jgi:hypothetical protein
VALRSIDAGVFGSPKVGLDGAGADERLVRSDVVVELAERVDHPGHVGAVGGQVAPGCSILMAPW